MFEVPHSAPRANGRRLALLWMGVAVISIIVSIPIYPLAVRIFNDSLSSFDVLFRVMPLLTGLLIVALQWQVLRRFFPAMGRWIPAHAAILIANWLLKDFTIRLASALLFVLSLISASPGGSLILRASITANLIWTLLTGLVGWWIFRPLTKRAWLWPVALLLGTIGQTLAVRLVLVPLIRSRATANTTTYDLTTTALSLAAAALQAAVLVVFLRERERPAAPELV